VRDGGMFANYKIVHKATLTSSGSVTKLSLYAIPGVHSPAPQSIKAVIYSDSGGSPGALLATGSEVVYRGNVNKTGWLDLPFSAAVALAPGTYWLGFITGSETEGLGYVYDVAGGSRAYSTNAYSSGPSNPFGAASKDSEQASIYATYVSSGPPAAPANTSPPTITGTAQLGLTLTEVHGSWTGEPTGFSYQWFQCNAEGGGCGAISGASAQTYAPVAGDVGHTLKVQETASNAGGAGSPAVSSATAVVTAAEATSHLEYVLQDGTISVYDMDHEYKLVKTISLPQTKSAQIRGVTVAPASDMMFIPLGGDGPANSSGNGGVLAYDLLGEKVSWEVKLNTGIDSGQVSADGTKLYIPSGENTTTGIWNVLSAANGELIGTIQGGSGAHNTVVSSNGQYVYLGGRLYNYLDVYETATGKVKEIGPLVGSVRPLTANGKNTLAYTTATGFDGFQISSVTTGKVLFTVSFGEVPSGFPFSAPSHGIALSPDERSVYVVDTVHKEIQFWDVSRVGEGVAPTQIGVVPVSGFTGEASPCLYDCKRSGWVQLSRDGRFLFVGDSGEVIETATRKVITTLPTLAMTKHSIEVDWQNGDAVATSGRTGVGYVE
jgi:Ig domain of plant-specific actin-binding protein